MASIPNYPIQDGHRTQYVRWPIQVTERVLESARNQGLPCANYLKEGQWIAVDVLESGYRINPASVSNDSEEYIRKACDVHNSWILDGDMSRVEEIVSLSMQND